MNHRKLSHKNKQCTRYQNNTCNFASDKCWFSHEMKDTGTKVSSGKSLPQQVFLESPRKSSTSSENSKSSGNESIGEDERNDGWNENFNERNSRGKPIPIIVNQIRLPKSSESKETKKVNVKKIRISKNIMKASQLPTVMNLNPHSVAVGDVLLF